MSLSDSCATRGRKIEVAVCVVGRVVGAGCATLLSINFSPAALAGEKKGSFMQNRNTPINPRPTTTTEVRREVKT
jgi:hypothetical protein